VEFEKQVCGLELAKLLKELGVKQESLFYHVFNKAEWHKESIEESRRKYPEDTFDDPVDRWEIWPADADPFSLDTEFYAAFTVAEFGELLPDGVKISCTSPYEHEVIYTMKQYKDNKIYHVYLHHTSYCYYCSHEDTLEANARAKMLIYLIENKLIEIKQ